MRERMTAWAAWYRERDRDLAALRRATRAAILLPLMFVVGGALGGATTAMFASFGTFAMVLLADIAGQRRERVETLLLLVGVGVVLISVGTLASRTPVVAGLSMALVAFLVLFAAVTSSVLSGLVPALLLAFILPVSIAAPPGDVPLRLLGWLLAGAGALVAVAFLWPAPVREPLRSKATAACRALAAALTASIAAEDPGWQPHDRERRDTAVREAGEAVAALHRQFTATPYRPTSLSAEGRALVGVVDHLGWMQQVLANLGRTEVVGRPLDEFVAVKHAVIDVLEQCARVLDDHDVDGVALSACLDRLDAAMHAFEGALAAYLHDRTDEGDADDGPLPSLLRVLDRSFRVQEIGYGAAQLGQRTLSMAEAERRSWWQRLLGQQPEGAPSPTRVARRRLAAHLDLRSVWLHNSIRGAVALGLATFVATGSGVSHAFWVVLGTMSVLRSNALATGQNVMRAVLGTSLGFLVGSALMLAIGSHTAVLWVLLPIAVLVAGIAPSAVSFLAGQAGFTVMVVVLFNLITPVGWSVGAVRVEDVAIGCLVSLGVGLLFWPRGARAALRAALGDAYARMTAYLTASVSYAAARCGASGEPVDVDQPAAQALAAATRLDDAFRTFLNERGPKTMPLADVVALVTGVVRVRLAADSIVTLWHEAGAMPVDDASVVRDELAHGSRRVELRFDAFASSLADGSLPPAATDDGAERVTARVLAVVRDELASDEQDAPWTALRVAWTADLLDAVAHTQDALAQHAAARA